MTTPTQKGNALEAAVQAIETIILRNSPSYREDTFVIHRKKIIVVNGVKHEIDIWVEVDLAAGYKPIFIFECKNWDSEKVNKNEIIVFAEKIKASQAQRGFFVAKSFTGDAEAQSKQEPRMQLLHASELPLDIPIPWGFHFLIHEIKDLQVELGIPGGPHPPAAPIRFEMTELLRFADGRTTKLCEYSDSWAREIMHKHSYSFASGEMPEGDYPLSAEGQRNFQQGEVMIGEHAVVSASLRVGYLARVRRPAIIWHYEVATRGRVLSLAPVEMPGQFTADVRFIDPSVQTPDPRIT
jgi:hypothetical protein